MRKGVFENVLLTGRREGKRDKGNECVICLAGLSKSMMTQVLGEGAQVQNMLTATSDREKWRA